MNATVRSAMVGASSAAIVIAAWVARPGGDDAVAVASVVADTTVPVTTPAPADASRPDDPVVIESVADDESSASAVPVDASAGDASIEAPTGVAQGSVLTATPMSLGPELLPAAQPVVGSLSAAPLDIDADTVGIGGEPEAALGRTDCQAYADEEWRRDELGLIDWEAMEYVELTEEQIEARPLELPRYETGVAAPWDEQTFVDMGAPMAIEDLPTGRLLEVTSRCWEGGFFDE